MARPKKTVDPVVAAHRKEMLQLKERVNEAIETAHVALKDLKSLAKQIK